jgi:pilus assembly protein CpaB
MSAPTSSSGNSPARLVLGFLLGGFAGLGVALVVGGPFAYAQYTRLKREARAGWNLVPVVVAAVDIPKGEPITFDVISQRSVPEQFVSTSMVRPDSASYVVNASPSHTFEAGQPLLWTSFDDKRLTQECAGAVRTAAASGASSPNLESFLGAVQARAARDSKR